MGAGRAVIHSREDGAQEGGALGAGGPQRGAPGAQAEARLRAVVRDLLGDEELRPGQEEAIRALWSGRDALVVLPTGWGKSAIYQIAGRLLGGTTVVVSPLLALQRDQAEGMRGQLGDRVRVLNSDLAAGEEAQTLEDVREGLVEVLFVAPETLARSDVRESLAAARPRLAAIDEAHCISSWGHDFRPAYLRLGSLLADVGRPVRLALTATASPPVRSEIEERLALRGPAVIVRGFDRPNIFLCVRRAVEEHDKEGILADELASEGGSCIVYVATRGQAEEIASTLEGSGTSAAAYHGSMARRRRQEAQDAFMAGTVRVMVATNAFGMGIDKPDVRAVVHHDVPVALDDYHQEIGRAGRDGMAARAVLIYRPEDLRRRRFYAAEGPLGPARLGAVAAALERAGGRCELQQLRRETGLTSARLTAALALLEEVGALSTTAGHAISVAGDRWPEQLEEALASERSRGEVRRSRLAMMRGYAEAGSCRRQLLTGYFGEQIGACGNCDRCLVDQARGPNDAAAQGTRGDAAARGEPGGLPPGSRVEHAEWGAGLLMSYEEDVMTILFDEAGYKTLQVQLVEERDLLRVLPDAGARPQASAGAAPGD